MPFTFPMSLVYFYPLSKNTDQEEVYRGIDSLYESADFGNLFERDEFSAIKVHFGEKGNTSYLSPDYVSRVISLMKTSGARIFLTDANTIYKGERANTVDHMNVAFEHGFLPSVTGVPIIIADGLTGKDYRRIRVNKKHFKHIKVGSLILDCKSMMVLSHFKGHMLAGFGGALKNVGMGLAARSGKQEQHSDVKPVVTSSACIRCLSCLESCPVNAISEMENSAFIHDNICIGCGECTAACPTGAIKVRWQTDNRTFQEKMIEYTYGILAHFNGKAGFINFLINITPHCDCMESDDPPIVDDIGILASLDPVALDNACADLVNSRPGLASANFGKRMEPIAAGVDKFQSIHNINWTHQLHYAEKLGIGSNEYELVEVGKGNG